MASEFELRLGGVGELDYLRLLKEKEETIK